MMMPLDTINLDGSVKNMTYVTQSLEKLKKAGTHGIMLDVWWGIAEKDEPGKYNFDGYYKIVEAAKSAGLTLQAVMSFHKCGGNVGDDVTIPLPQWALSVAKSNDLLYKDQWNHQNEEYISAGADNEKVFPAANGGLRTPLTIYKDFMSAFASKMKKFIDDGTIDDI